mgnify:CR=1 FL=1
MTTGSLWQKAIRCKQDRQYQNGKAEKSDPSTTNLLALADLFGISAEDLLKEVQ